MILPTLGIEALSWLAWPLLRGSTDTVAAFSPAQATLRTNVPDRTALVSADQAKN